MIQVKKGNVLDSPFQVIAHQVNCQGVMGAGVARAIKTQYPEIFSIYEDTCESNGATLMGKTMLTKTNDGKIIANLFGQDSYGTHSRQTNYKSLHKALIGLRKAMEENSLVTLSFPHMIGCGLAGGDEEVVISLIEDVFDDSDIIYNFYDIKS